MRTYMKDVLFGILIFFIVMLAEFIVTLPFDEVSDGVDRTEWAGMINRELLLATLPAGAITFIFARILKTRSKACALRRACIWSSILAVFYLAISINNGNADLMFGTIGIYGLIFCTFTGPILAAVIQYKS